MCLFPYKISFQVQRYTSHLYNLAQENLTFRSNLGKIHILKNHSLWGPYLSEYINYM